MPRRKAPAPVVDDEQLLAMPTLIGTSRKEHEHRVDPYKSLPGGMPEPEPVPPGKKARKEELEAQQRAAGRARLTRYDRFLDNLADYHGDEVHALATVYQVSIEEAMDRRDELLLDVQTGVPTSSIAEDLKRRNIHRAAQVRILAKWMYSANPAASLKALDMAREMEGSGPDMGSFEQYARIATARE